MRVAIVGSGGIAQVHAPIIARQRDVELVSVVDTDLERAQALAGAHRVEHAHRDVRGMISERKPDLVHVLVPPQLHAAVSIEAMEQGCHVLVEKPMALLVADARRMIDSARENAVKLCVNHSSNFDRVVRQALKLVEKGSIGEVVSVEARAVYNVERSAALIEPSAASSHWSYRMNGGPLEDVLPHPAAQIVKFVPEIRELQSVTLNRGVLPNGWPDEVRVVIRSERVIGYLSVSFSERPDIDSVTIRGTRGIVHADSFASLLSLRKESRLPRSLSRGLSGLQTGLQLLGGSVANVVRVVSGRMEQAGGIEVVISRFYDAVRTGGEPPVSLESSLRVVELMNRVWPGPPGRDGRDGPTDAVDGEEAR